MNSLNVEVARPAIGLVLPSAQTVTEPLFVDVAGDALVFHATRVPLRGSQADDIAAMEKCVPAAVDLLADAGCEAIVYACTSSAAMRGYREETAFVGELSRRAATPVISSAFALIDVLQEMNAESVEMFSPYVAELAQAEYDLLVAAGFQVRGHHDLGIAKVRDIAAMRPNNIFDFVSTTAIANADAIVLPCMNWNAYPTIVSLEQKLSRPVVTSHSALLWRLAREFRLTPWPSLGSLPAV